ncbi:hypothetical protein NMG60_11014090 [Bertholletia excelsa]
MRSLNSVLATLVLVIFLLSIERNQASRLLRGGEEEGWMKKQSLLLLSSERGPGQPSGPNGGYIPASSTSTIGQRGFAGHATPPPPHDSHPRVSVLLPSLRGPVPPSGPNPPTHIPARSFGQKGYAGHATRPPPHASHPRDSALLPSLRGSVTPSAPNPSTHIPASSFS